jgi:hypothetical protein
MDLRKIACSGIKPKPACTRTGTPAWLSEPILRLANSYARTVLVGFGQEDAE